MNQPERGVIGIGEPPTISTAAAVANAVANAIGVRVRSLPITPDKVLTRARRAREDGRHAVKAFAYVNARQSAGSRGRPEHGRRAASVLPLAGGMDLLGLMKDYIAQPDVLVNVKKLPAGDHRARAGPGGRSARRRRWPTSPRTRRWRRRTPR